MSELVPFRSQPASAAEVIDAPDVRITLVQEVLDNEYVYLNERGRIVATEGIAKRIVKALENHAREIARG